MTLTEDKPRTEAERLPDAERQAPEQRVESPHPELSPPPPARARTRRRPRLLLIVLAVLLAIGATAGGLDWWLSTRNWVSTDDAFIDVHMVQVSSQVAGRVNRVLVTDNQEVRAGQTLVELDPADLQAQLDQALANQQGAAGTLAQAKAQLPVAQANFDAARAQIVAAQAANNNATIQLQRDEALQRYGSLAITRQKLDADTATARADAANLAAAQQKAAAAKAQIDLDQKDVQKAEAGVRGAVAQVEQARLSRSYTTIRAAQSGRIAKLNVAAGDYIQIGQNVMAIVPDTVWVTANFKETDLAHMRIGDPVDIYVDAYPDHVFHGHVQSIQPGSGAAFSLLPPENATGNYIKVVQRVPVKIVFNGDPGAHWLLGPGMSVEPSVKIR